MPFLNAASPFCGGLLFRYRHHARTGLCAGRQKEARRDPPLPTPRRAYKQDGYSLSSGYSGIFPICLIVESYSAVGADDHWGYKELLFGSGYPLDFAVYCRYILQANLA